jgi:Leucine-rich repeat (LRR) protein
VYIHAGLTNCLKLEDLNLSDNLLSSLKGLTRLPLLDCLRVDGNQLRSLEGLTKPLLELTELYITRNFLTSLEGLAKACPNLEILDAAENKLGSVKRLQVWLKPTILLNIKSSSLSNCLQVPVRHHKQRGRKKNVYTNPNVTNPTRVSQTLM